VTPVAGATVRWPKAVCTLDGPVEESRYQSKRVHHPRWRGAVVSQVLCHLRPDRYIVVYC